MPLVVAGPGLPRGQARADLVSGIDITVTKLALAGVERPAWMEGRDSFAPNHEVRDYVISARYRCAYPALDLDGASSPATAATHRPLFVAFPCTLLIRRQVQQLRCASGADWQAPKCYNRRGWIRDGSDLRQLEDLFREGIDLGVIRWGFRFIRTWIAMRSTMNVGKRCT